MKKFRIVVTAIIAAAFLNGCYLDDFKNIDEIRIEPISPTFVFPLLNSTVTISDLIEGLDSTVFIDIRDEIIYITFVQETDFDLDLNSFKIPDKEFSSTLPIVAGVAYEFYKPDYVTIENESEIKSVELKSGNLQVEFSRDFIDDDMVFELIINSLTNDANPTGVVLTPNWSGDLYNNTLNFDLSGALLNLYHDDTENGGGILYNTFTYALKVASTGTSAGNLITRIAISSVEFNEVTGLINYEMDLPAQDMNLDAFSSVVNGRLYLKNPSLRFDIGTSFGVPSVVEITDFSFKDNAGNPFVLVNEGVAQENTFLLGTGNKNYLPYAKGDIPYEMKSYALNGDNSNIEDILPFTPSKMSFNGKFSLGQAEIMPANPHNFFVKDTSSFDLKLNVEIPLEGSIEDLEFSYDLYDLSWPALDSIPMVSNFDFNIELLMKTTNEIPLTFGLQAVFFEGGQVIDSLFNDVLVENVIESPNPQDNPLNPTMKETKVSISKDKYERISKASKVQLVLHLETGTEGHRDVVFKTSHKLGVQLAIKFAVDIKADI